MSKDISRKCWVAVNKNSFICMFVNEPTRNNETGKWDGIFYIDSFIYNIVQDIVAKAKMSWESDAEFFEFGPKID